MFVITTSGGATVDASKMNTFPRSRADTFVASELAANRFPDSAATERPKAVFAPAAPAGLLHIAKSCNSELGWLFVKRYTTPLLEVVVGPLASSRPSGKAARADPNSPGSTPVRSEERRVGKECRSRRGRC